MKITSETTSEEVRERMEETLQTMCNVENNNEHGNQTGPVSEQIQNDSTSSVNSERTKEDTESYLYFLDKVQNGFSSEEQRTLDLLKKQRNSENPIGSKIKNAIDEMTKEKYEKLSDLEKAQYYLENASGRTEQDITPGAKALSAALKSGELQGPSIIRKYMNCDNK